MSSKNCCWNIKITSDFLLCRQVCDLRNDINQKFILFLAHKCANSWYNTDNNTSTASQTCFGVILRISDKLLFIFCNRILRYKTLVKRQSQLKMSVTLKKYKILKRKVKSIFNKDVLLQILLFQLICLFVVSVVIFFVDLWRLYRNLCDLRWLGWWNVFEFAVKIVLESEGQPDVVFLQNAIASSNEDFATSFCINQRRVLWDHVFGYFC